MNLQTFILFTHTYVLVYTCKYIYIYIIYDIMHTLLCIHTLNSIHIYIYMHFINESNMY